MLGVGVLLLVVAGIVSLAGTVMFVRGVVRRLEPGTKTRSVLMPVAVTLGMQLLTLVQLASLASPIFPERTVFGGGIDHLAQSSHVHPVAPAE